MKLEKAIAEYNIVEKIIAISDDDPAPGAYEEWIVSSKIHGPYNSKEIAQQFLEPIKSKLQRQCYEPTNQMSHQNGPVELVKVGSPPFYVNFSIQREWVEQK